MWALEFVGFIFLIVGVSLKSTMVCAIIPVLLHLMKVLNIY